MLFEKVHKNSNDNFFSQEIFANLFFLCVQRPTSCKDQTFQESTEISVQILHRFLQVCFISSIPTTFLNPHFYIQNYSFFSPLFSFVLQSNCARGNTALIPHVVKSCLQSFKGFYLPVRQISDIVLNACIYHGTKETLVFLLPLTSVFLFQSDFFCFCRQCGNGIIYLGF